MIALAVVLVLLAVVAVYLPFVQRFAFNKVAQIVERETGIGLVADDFRVRFPLGVEMRGVTVVMTGAGGAEVTTPSTAGAVATPPLQGGEFPARVADTLARVGGMRVRAALLPLLEGRVRLMDFAVTDAHADWRDTLSGMALRGRIDTLNGGSVWFDPAARTVRLSRVVLAGGDVAMAMGSGETPEADSLPMDWKFELDRFELSRFGFEMAEPAIKITEAGFALSDLRFDMGSGEGGVRLEGLRLTEQSGLRVTDGGAKLAMTAQQYSVEDLLLTTAGSRITGALSVGGGIATLDPHTPVAGELLADIDPDEVAIFAPLPAECSKIFDGHSATLGVAVGGTIDDLRIERFTADLPPGITLSARGEVRHAMTPEQMSGNVTIEGALSELEFARSFIPDTALRRRVAFPRHMKLDAEARFSPQEIDLQQFILLADSGRMEARARFGIKTQSYDAHMAMTDFPLGAFLPHDSLGSATMSINASGEGFDPIRLRATASLSLDRLRWNGTQLGRVTADIEAARGRYKASIRGRNELIAINISLNARLARDTLAMSRRWLAYRAQTAARVAAGDTLDVSRAQAFRDFAARRSASMRRSRGSTARRRTPLMYSLDARVDSTVVWPGSPNPLRIDPVTLTASASRAGAKAAMRSGDMTFDAASPLSIELLLSGAAGAGNEIARQLEARNFSPDSLQNALPRMTLRARAGRNNFLRHLARENGFDFRKISVDISTTPDSPFHIDATAVGVNTGALAVDTLDLHAMRNGSMLDYRLRMANRPTTLTNLGLIGVQGSIGGRAMTANVLQRNPAGTVGFDFGVGVMFADTAIVARMLPAPILGYERWRVGSRTIAQTPDNGNTAGTATGTSAADTTATRRRTRQSNQGQFDRAAWHRLITDRVAAERLAAVNSWIAGEWIRAGDWVAISTDGTITADLQLTTRMPQPSALQLSLTPAGQARPGGPAANSTGPAGERPRRPVRFINLTSASLPGIPDGALRLSAGGLDLAAMLDLFPTAPRIGGTLSSDLTFGFHPDGAGDYIIAARGDLTAKDFAYEGRRIADIGADINFGSGNAGSHEGKSPAHGVLQLDAAVSLESRQAVTARGTWAADGMDFTVDIPAVPLSIAQNLIPPGSATLHGAFDGRLRITGQPDKPVVTGDVGFTDARADIALIGTSFGISPDRVRIADNRVTFTDWGLTAPNNRKMAVNGAINIANPAAPRADLTIRARDFQFVNSRHVGGSQIYGNGSLDANITARGPLDAMTVRGDVDLAGTSDIVYIMRDEAKSVRDEKQHIVQFVSFADSLYADDETILPPIRRAGVDVLIGVGIGSGLKATLSLDELNENRMHLVGGGDLTYSMNSQGDTRLAGRYTLTGGTLYYKPPVIPQKVFAVTDGSYVEWAGAVDQPRLKIAATQNLKVRLDQENGASQDVDFLVSIDIAGSLAGMDMSFDLAAPSNLAIQNQLMVMRPEEKQQQALTLLIYNRYTGLGGTTSTKGMMEFDARGQLGNFISKEINQWARNNLRGVDFSMGIDTRSDMVGDTRTDYSYNVSKSIFSDRVKISIGGKVSDEATSENFANSLLEDVSLEYRLTERDNMYLKLYRYNTRESILEGEVTETGAGFMIRKKVDRLGDIFRRQRPPRRYLRQLRESEKTTNER